MTDNSFLMLLKKIKECWYSMIQSLTLTTTEMCFELTALVILKGISIKNFHVIFNSFIRPN